MTWTIEAVRAQQVAAEALAYGLGPLPAISLGIISGIGGGILRDLLAGETPTVFRRGSDLYAVPAGLGAIIVVVAQALDAYGAGEVIVAVSATFVFRMLALWRGWRAPRPGALWPRPERS
jgi:uncharacterized membrane protein YeiH